MVDIFYIADFLQNTNSKYTYTFKDISASESVQIGWKLFIYYLNILIAMVLKMLNAV